MCGRFYFYLAVFLSISSVTVAQQRRTVTGKLLSQVTKPRVTDKLPMIFSRIRNSYRSYNGSMNNLGSIKGIRYGSTNIPLLREIPAQYGPTDRNNAMGGATRPSARRISNALISEPVTQFNARKLSAFVYVWGQFLDHDISLTPTANTESVPIVLPGDEVIFTEPIPFTRSEVYAGTGTGNTRQQINLNTAWIDGSMIYGSDTATAKWLRTGKLGKLKTSNAGKYLPYNTLTGEKTGAIDPAAPAMANDNGHTAIVFVAGDNRASEHPGILGLQTLFVREHNRICDILKKQRYINDEQMYQLARKEVGALIQQITYQEFLPAIGITLKKYGGYNPAVQPDIMNTFATAGYRIGHTMVADDLMLIANDCSEMAPGELDLIDVFWAPQTLLDYTPEAFFKGFAAHTQYETDTKINDVLRNFLFGSPNDPVRFGIDLGSLNIQRGRDHGLPDYNTVRKFYTGKHISSFQQITDTVIIADSIQKLYGNVNDIDLWVGILAEDHLPGKSVGPTMHEMLRVQFEKLRDGDFYFYQSDPYLLQKSKARIATSRLSDIIKRNTTLKNLQSNVFFTEECPGSGGERRTDSLAVTEMSASTNVFGATIFPNPVSTILSVNLGIADPNTVIKIFASNGTLVKSLKAAGSLEQLDVSGYQPGLYIIRIEKGTAVQTLKFVKI